MASPMKRKAALACDENSPKKKKKAAVENDKEDAGECANTSKCSDTEILAYYSEKRRSAQPAGGKEFRFNKKRVRVISEAKDIPEDCKGVVYWMFRDQRVEGFTHILLNS